MDESRRNELAALRQTMPQGAKLMAGKVMLGNHTTQGGKPCTVIAGVLVGDSPVIGDDHAGMLVDILIIPRSQPQVTTASPEDFIENPDFPVVPL